MKKTFSIVSIALLLVLFSHCNTNQRELRRQLMQEAAIINVASPMMLNQYIRLDGASVTDNNRFQYHYTILYTSNPDSLLSLYIQSFREMAQVLYFTTSEMAIFRENDVIVDWKFNDEQGRTIYTVTITPEDQ